MKFGFALRRLALIGPGNAPAEVTFTRGLNVIAVHFFILYYAMLSAITPPVGAAAFLAATIAGAKPMQTSITAMRLGVVIYFVPLFFLFQPALFHVLRHVGQARLQLLHLPDVASFARGIERLA